MLALRPYTVGEFREYLRGYRNADVRATILHHTYRPNRSQWQGQASIESIRRYHMYVRDFRDIAANAYAAPSGLVWNARPVTWRNSASSYISRSLLTIPRRLRDVMRGNRQFLNRYGFAVETVGDFDVEDPTESTAMSTALDVLAECHRLWEIPVGHCFFHRDGAEKSCPGERVQWSWVQAELDERLGTPAVDPKVVRLPGTFVIDCRARIEEGVMRADLRALAEALGYEVHAEHLSSQNKIYLLRNEEE